MIPAADTRLILEDEIQGAGRWAQRHCIDLVWLPDQLELRVILVQLGTKELFYLVGRFQNYRALPPIWACMSKAYEGGVNEPRNFPKPLPGSRFGSSIFIEHAGGSVICAPFNRLAYQESGGPHADWGASAAWLTAGGTYVRATTVGDMLQAIHRDFRLTQGRMRE
jgi:hypothetical protein